MKQRGSTKRRYWIALVIAATIVVALVWIGVRRYRPAPETTKPIRTACGVHCGTERWAVKTLSEEGVNCIDFTPKQTTIAWLVSQAAPGRLSDDSRSGPVECQIWQLTGRLVGFKAEDDGDFHIVLADLNDPNLTMIVEIPDSDCSGACASAHEADIVRAREDFIRSFGKPNTRYHRVGPDQVVTVSGAGFFDFKHRQTGLASNGIELHPLIGFRVGGALQ
jgi:hypothetical protein